MAIDKSIGGPGGVGYAPPGATGAAMAIDKSIYGPGGVGYAPPGATGAAMAIDKSVDGPGVGYASGISDATMRCFNTWKNNPNADAKALMHSCCMLDSTLHFETSAKREAYCEAISR
jgi:hypothetical protein